MFCDFFESSLICYSNRQGLYISGVLCIYSQISTHCTVTDAFHFKPLDIFLHTPKIDDWFVTTRLTDHVIVT
jgi:hypothetical protein